MRGIRTGRRMQQRRDVSSDLPVNDGYWKNVRPESVAEAYGRKHRHLAIARCRHLLHTDDLVKNVVRSLKRHVVGVGPTIRFALPRGTTEQEAMLNREFAAWQEAAGYNRSLGGSLTEVAVAGESLRLLQQNSRVDHPIQWAIEQVNPYRIADPAGEGFDCRDGIKIDDEGNVKSFTVLDAPLYSQFYHIGEYETYEIGDVFWHVNSEEPGQPRYLPELGCAAMVAGSLVSYNAAEINTAILASSLGVFMTSTDPHNIDSQFASDTADDDVEVLQIDQMQIVNAPDGKTIQTVKNEGANSNYGPFVDVQERKVCRSVGVSKNVGTGSSEGSSYSGNKADHREMQTEVDVRRADLVTGEIRPLCRRWLRAAVAAYGLNPDSIRGAGIGVIWPGMPKLDPREHAADISLVQSGMMSLSEYAASKGRQVDEWLKEVADDYGTTVEEVRRALARKNLGVVFDEEK